jgi:hypothetical protein
MFARVPIRRAIAAQRHAALLARAQMHPGGTDLYALGALQTRWMFDVFNCVKMRTTTVIHDYLEFLLFVAANRR